MPNPIDMGQDMALTCNNGCDLLSPELADAQQQHPPIFIELYLSSR